MQEQSFDLGGFSHYWLILPGLYIGQGVLELVIYTDLSFQTLEPIFVGLLILGLMYWAYSRFPKKSLNINQESIRVVKRNKTIIELEYSDIQNFQLAKNDLILTSDSDQKIIDISNLKYEKRKLLKSELNKIAELKDLEMVLE